jgi:hypothetical protein
LNLVIPRCAAPHCTFQFQFPERLKWPFPDFSPIAPGTNKHTSKYESPQSPLLRSPPFSFLTWNFVF